MGGGQIDRLTPSECSFPSLPSGEVHTCQSYTHIHVVLSFALQSLRRAGICLASSQARLPPPHLRVPWAPHPDPSAKLKLMSCQRKPRPEKHWSILCTAHAHTQTVLQKVYVSDFNMLKGQAGERPRPWLFSLGLFSFFDRALVRASTQHHYLYASSFTSLDSDSQRHWNSWRLRYVSVKLFHFVSAPTFQKFFLYKTHRPGKHLGWELTRENKSGMSKKKKISGK